MYLNHLSAPSLTFDTSSVLKRIASNFFEIKPNASHKIEPALNAIMPQIGNRDIGTS